MSGPPPDVQAQLAALQRDYAARLPARAVDLSRRFAALRVEWSPDAATELRRLVHNLAGSGASYGFPSVSSGARAVERALDEALAQHTPPSAAALDAIGQALQALVDAADAVRPD